MKVITLKYKLEKWKAIITHQMASGLTAAEYCRQEDSILVEWLRNKLVAFRLFISELSNHSHSKKTNTGISRNFPMEKSILAVFVHRQLQRR